MPEGKSPRHSLAQRLERSRKHRHWLGKDSSSSQNSLTSTSPGPANINPSSPTSYPYIRANPSARPDKNDNVEDGTVNSSNSMGKGKLDARQQRALQLSRRKYVDRTSMASGFLAPERSVSDTKPIQSPTQCASPDLSFGYEGKQAAISSRARITSSYEAIPEWTKRNVLKFRKPFIETGMRENPTQRKNLHSSPMQPSSPCESMIYQASAMESDEGDGPAEEDPVMFKPGRVVRPVKSPKEAYQILKARQTQQELSSVNPSWDKTKASRVHDKEDRASKMKSTVRADEIANSFRPRDSSFSYGPKHALGADETELHGTLSVPRGAESRWTHKSSSSSPGVNFDGSTSSPQNAAAETVGSRWTSLSTKTQTHGSTIDTCGSVSFASLRASFNSRSNQPIMPMNSKDPRVRASFSAFFPDTQATTVASQEKKGTIPDASRPSDEHKRRTPITIGDTAPQPAMPNLVDDSFFLGIRDATQSAMMRMGHKDSCNNSADTLGGLFSTAYRESHTPTVDRNLQPNAGSPEENGRECLYTLKGSEAVGRSIHEVASSAFSLSKKTQQANKAKAAEGNEHTRYSAINSITTDQLASDLLAAESVKKYSQHPNVARLSESPDENPNEDKDSASIANSSREDTRIVSPPISLRSENTAAVAIPEGGQDEIGETMQSVHSRRGIYTQNHYRKAPWKVDFSPEPPAESYCPAPMPAMGSNLSRTRGASTKMVIQEQKRRTEMQASGPAILPDKTKFRLPSVFSKTKPLPEKCASAIVPTVVPVVKATDQGRREADLVLGVEMHDAEQLVVHDFPDCSDVIDLPINPLIDEKKSNVEPNGLDERKSPSSEAGILVHKGQKANDGTVDGYGDQNTGLARMAGESSLVVDYEQAMSHASRANASHDDADSRTVGYCSSENSTMLPEDLPSEFESVLSVPAPCVADEADILKDGDTCTRLAIKQSDSTSVYIEDGPDHGQSEPPLDRDNTLEMNLMSPFKLSRNSMQSKEDPRDKSSSEPADDATCPALTPSIKDNETYQMGYFGKTFLNRKPRKSPQRTADSSSSSPSAGSSAPWFTTGNDYFFGTDEKWTEVLNKSPEIHDNSSHPSNELSSTYAGRSRNKIKEESECGTNVHVEHKLSDQFVEHAISIEAKNVTDQVKLWAYRSASEDEHDEAMKFVATDEWLSKDPDFELLAEDESLKHDIDKSTDKLIRFSLPASESEAGTELAASGEKGHARNQPTLSSAPCPRNGSLEASSKSKAKRDVFDPFIDGDTLPLENSDDLFPPIFHDHFPISQSSFPFSWGGNPDTGTSQQSQNFVEI